LFFIKEVRMGNLRQIRGAQLPISSSPFDITENVAGLCAGLSFIQKGEEKKCAN
jgi:hypothetical protein